MCGGRLSGVRECVVVVRATNSSRFWGRDAGRGITTPPQEPLPVVVMAEGGHAFPRPHRPKSDVFNVPMAPLTPIVVCAVAVAA